MSGQVPTWRESRPFSSPSPSEHLIPAAVGPDAAPVDWDVIFAEFTPQQTDDVSCGVFVIANALAVATLGNKRHHHQWQWGNKTVERLTRRSGDAGSLRRQSRRAAATASTDTTISYPHRPTNNGLRVWADVGEPRTTLDERWRDGGRAVEIL